MMTREEWKEWLAKSWDEAQARTHTIKTWRDRCEEHPDHEGIVTEQMIRNRMQEEIDELRQAIEQAETREWVGLTDEEIDAAWRSVDYKVDYYHCVICGKFIEAVDGVIVHDDIPHPPLMDFDEESNPQ